MYLFDDLPILHFVLLLFPTGLGFFSGMSFTPSKANLGRFSKKGFITGTLLGGVYSLFYGFFLLAVSFYYLPAIVIIGVLIFPIMLGVFTGITVNLDLAKFKKGFGIGAAISMILFFCILAGFSAM